MKKDLINKKFNKLVVLEKYGTNKYNKQLWKCKCDCGKEIIIDTSSLTTGNTKSCGCYKNELIKNLNYKHGKSHTQLYYVWQSMRKRCLNKKNKEYRLYGERGIKVCKEWLNDFQCFYIWAIQNGYKKGLSIDRINVNGNYEPNNCRWTTYKEQANNTRRNKYIEYLGNKITISNACKKIKIPVSTIYSKSKRKNLSLQKAFDSYLERS